MSVFEQHYSPKQLAEKWGFSARFVRDLFAREPGILVADRPEELHKRRYTTLRIPESVALRVYTRMQSKGRVRKSQTPSRPAPLPVEPATSLRAA